MSDAWWKAETTRAATVREEAMPRGVAARGRGDQVTRAQDDARPILRSGEAAVVVELTPDRGGQRPADATADGDSGEAWA